MAKKRPPVPIGKKIRKVRLEKKMTLDLVASDTGCSIDYLKRVESGVQIPPVGTLLQIARALRIDSGFLLKEQEQVQQERVKAYIRRTDNYAYETLTPGAENKHLKAFRVTIEAGQEHQGVGYRHVGEEFVYVLQGQVEIAVGDHLNQLGPTDTLHFNSGIKHHMRNIGDMQAALADMDTPKSTRSNAIIVMQGYLRSMRARPRFSGWSSPIISLRTSASLKNGPDF